MQVSERKAPRNAASIRNEEIKTQAITFCKQRCNQPKFDYIRKGAYIAGAQWADKNPPLGVAPSLPNEPDWKAIAQELAEVLKAESNFFVNCYKARHSEKVQKALAKFNELKESAVSER